ncbi:hypothetical protein ILUMI_14817 [Ignelater luminosus]|uniref:DDE Tnp4 domain-containing protein n=1 Tax=Ignelater luminosus TaxID=2038154 RepID=A0A8K0CU86_IGNLU|nr:hypothetical protein ILUMI_14817 [Ignelater luminosus]
MPSTQEEWQTISDKFQEIWNFPHCIGAIDGKLVVLQAPINTGSDLYNYKSQFSIVLLALVDAEYNFLLVDVGCKGRISDGGVFKNCILYKQIETQKLNLPKPTIIEELSTELPFFFLGDAAFPLSEHIMKPYSGIHPNGSTKRIFNYRLSRARRVVENAFGILSNVFRVLRKPMLLQPETAQLVVMATVCLHNFLRNSHTSRDYYTPPTAFDIEINGETRPGDWRQDQNEQISVLPLKSVARRNKVTAEKVRDNLANYFCTSGALHWQDKYT